MFKYYVRLALLIGSVLALIALVGSLLPRSYDFQTEVLISAEPSEVFPLLNTLDQWPRWSRQFNPDEIDGLEIEYSGKRSGVGAAQTWTDRRGAGKLWITEAVADQSLEYDMTFANFPKMNSRIELTRDDGQTRVQWRSRGKLPGGPFYGYFGSFFSTQMIDQYDKSLTRLKEVAEAQSSGEAVD